MVAVIDPVTKRLAEMGTEPAGLLDWIESRRRRQLLHRRAIWCTLGAWLLVTAAASIGSVVAYKFSRDVQATFADMELFDFHRYGDHEAPLPATVYFVPPILATIALLSLIGGVWALLTGRFPGLCWAHSAIDWEQSSDAVSRLVSIGCTYPEALEVAAKVARTNSNRRWLFNASRRIQAGSSHSTLANSNSGDIAVLQSLLDISHSEPAITWGLAKRHFAEVARGRLALLQGTLPIIATLLAGLLVWLSISATLGWMWVTVARMVSGYH